jgi:hypothetical protein
MTVKSNQVNITVEAPNPNKCTTGQYITINGKAYQYEYSPNAFPPSTYDKSVPTPDFCVYYTGAYIVYNPSPNGGILEYSTSPPPIVPIGCYCNPGIPGSDLFVGKDTFFRTDGNGHWFATISLNTTQGFINSWQIEILWNE